MLWSIVWSPIPLVINFLLLLGFTRKRISANKWAKIGKRTAASLILLQIMFMFVGYSNKVADGNRYLEAYHVTTFTKHINQLLTEKRYSEANEKLNTFNEKYIDIVRQPGESKKFIQSLTTEQKRQLTLRRPPVVK